MLLTLGFEFLYVIDQFLGHLDLHDAKTVLVFHLTVATFCKGNEAAFLCKINHTFIVQGNAAVSENPVPPPLVRGHHQVDIEVVSSSG
jgi:hypothetical protein